LGRPEVLKKFANTEFFNEMNQIYSLLPAAKEGYWSEIFKRDKEDI